MRLVKLAISTLALAAALGGCATESGYGYGYGSACERDYARNRAAATAAGALVGAAAGAAVARDDTAGALIGGILGGLAGRRLSRRDDPCGYGFGGYPLDPQYGRWDERSGRWRR